MHSAIASLQLLKLISAAKDCNASRQLKITSTSHPIHLQIGLRRVVRRVHVARLQQLRRNVLAEHLVGDEPVLRPVGVRIHRHLAAVFGDRKRAVALQPLHELVLRQRIRARQAEGLEAGRRHVRSDLIQRHHRHVEAQEELVEHAVDARQEVLQRGVRNGAVPTLADPQPHRGVVRVQRAEHGDQRVAVHAETVRSQRLAARIDSREDLVHVLKVDRFVARDSLDETDEVALREHGVVEVIDELDEASEENVADAAHVAEIHHHIEVDHRTCGEMGEVANGKEERIMVVESLANRIDGDGLGQRSNDLIDWLLKKDEQFRREGIDSIRSVLLSKKISTGRRGSSR